MGVEYELRFTDANERYTSFNVTTPEAIDGLLRQLPGFVGVSDGAYEFQVQGESVRATVEPYGIYLRLDRPTHANDLLFNHLVHRILNLYGGLEIVEL